MKNTKKTPKNVNAFDGEELSDLFCEFLEKKGHRDSLKAMDLMARHWFQGDLILEKEDFSDEFEYLAYYHKLTGEPMTEPVREALEDWLECCYPGRVDEIEQKLGIPSTLVSDPPRGERIETA